MAIHESVTASHTTTRPLEIAASPRSSVSADTSQSPRTPASPFLHNLHHRFRKGSNASSSMSSDATTSHATQAHTNPADRAETAQSAKRFLLSIVRNDWEFPVFEDSPVTEDSLKKDEILATREPAAWRTRQEAQSDIDLDSDGSINGHTRRKKRAISDPYKFENPDAIAASITERKVKRRRKVEAEMQWNDGLTLWSARRDAWTAAVESIPSKTLPTEQPNSHSHSIEPRSNDAPTTDVYGRNSQSTASSTQAVVNGESTPDWPLPAMSDISASSQSPHLPATVPGIDSDRNIPPPTGLVPLPERYPADSVDGPYLPIYPPLFPTSHTLRSRIKPAAYPTIYSKVVVQSLSPNVPIPLTHMIGALVDGWKAEGVWPPQTMAEHQAQIARKNGKNGRKGETAFGRWRRDQEEKRNMVKRANGMANMTKHNGQDDGDDEKKGFRRSITGAAKKLFGMNDEQETDGGLEKLGITFSENEDMMEDGLLVKDTQMMAEGQAPDAHGHS
jgi:hypothetical protein